MQQELEDRNNQLEQLEMIKSDYMQQMETLKDRLKQSSEAQSVLDISNDALVNQIDQKDSQIQDMEHKFGAERRDAQNQINSMMHNMKNVETELKEALKNLKTKEKECQIASKQSKQLVKQCTDAEYKLSKLQQKESQQKKVKKELENKLIQLNEKLQAMELQKKNEDLCSQMENTMPIAGGANELGELEDMNSSPDQNEQEQEN